MFLERASVLRLTGRDQRCTESPPAETATVPPGLADIQREIERAQRGEGRLIAAYVDVDGLKATNDAKGHHAGDRMLKHIVAVMQSYIRSYEQVVRLGGDEFVCTISDATIERVRERFDEISAHLSVTPATNQSRSGLRSSPGATHRWISSIAPTGS